MYRFLVELLQPYPLLFLVGGVALVGLWRKRQDRRRRLVVLTAAFIGLALLSTPAVSYLALGTLEWQYPAGVGRPADADAIVVLAAGVVYPDADGTRAEMDEDSRQRCLHALALYRQGKPCPVLLSGGKVDPEAPGPACARLMSDFLLDRGVSASDLIVEEDSRTTYENAVQSSRLLERHQLRKVVLVADAVDMYRAEGCFRKQGVLCIPAPCHWRAGRFEWSPSTFLPRPGAARGSQRAWHEWLGVGWYWLRGRI